ncbi:muellerian-inhibiting factor isoform X2 [Boleophthalmus pectinirostris]|uniref:muellerian-inhibiting factor isoform X2 n=1 Tax=Boleophthalmus pectinirostris TaxID=150288 RepID=UPI0024303538|nr:muellerian-inhibiting factor isoform X2 [Boleophthalmus pectinirostris]
MAYYAVLILGWTSVCASLQVSHHDGNTEVKEEIKDTTNILSPNSASSVTPQNAPCFLTKDASNEDLSVLNPTEVLLRVEEDKRELILTFGPIQRPQPILNPILLLPFESIFKMSEISFTSPHLNPNTQTPCISEESKYILLTVKDGHFPPTWNIKIQKISTDTKQDLLDGGDISSTISIFALLLFSAQKGTDTRPPNNNDLSHNSFLCELRHFLVQSSPQDHDAPLLNLELLQSLPSQPIGLSTSESLLADLINSSSPTILSFNQGSMLHAHHEELALSPALLEELRQRLEQTLGDVMEVMKDKEDSRARGRLERLKQLSGFPFADHVEGKLQYRAFLLFKALQMARRAFNPPRGQRSTRANPATHSVCGLKSLTVSLERYLIGPSTATINNCQGSCAFPMSRTNNHAVLLNSHIESGNTNERAPCCVPVAYDKMEVVDLGELGTSLKIEPDMVATDCECR